MFTTRRDDNPGGNADALVVSFAYASVTIYLTLAIGRETSFGKLSPAADVEGDGRLEVSEAINEGLVLLSVWNCKTLWVDRDLISWVASSFHARRTRCSHTFSYNDSCRL